MLKITLFGSVKATYGFIDSSIFIILYTKAIIDLPRIALQMFRLYGN